MTHRSQKLRDLARGKPCMARTEWCNGNPETTCWAHLNEHAAGRGAFHKSHDWLGFFACSSCHDCIDGRTHVTLTTGEERRDWARQAMVRTQAYLLDNELIEVRVSG